MYISGWLNFIICNFARSFVILPGVSSVNNGEVNNNENKVASRTVKKSSSKFSSRVDDNLTNNLEVNSQISLPEETVAVLEDNISDIDSEMKKSNTDVTNELTKRIEKYESLIDENTSTEEYEKIQELIHITEQLNLAYQEYNKNTSTGYETYAMRPTIQTGLTGVAYVAAVISATSSCGFDLFAELTTASLTTKYINQSYEPVNGTRVYSSQTLYDIGTNSAISGSAEFKFTEFYNTYEKDLNLAIRNFKYNKVSSTHIIIRDTYDYHPEEGRNPYEDTGIQGFAYDTMYQMQQMGIIYPVKVVINANYTDYLRLQILDKTDKTWKISVTNYKDKPLDIIYNTKMCSKDDAKEWSGLSDIATIRIGAKSSAIVYVKENLMATDFAFSYVNGGQRYITYANETYLASFHGLNAEVKKVSYNYYDNIGIIGKNGSNWIIKYTNTDSQRQYLQYKTKMCFEGDAKNWSSNPNDICYYGYVDAGKSCIFFIQENVLATHISIRISDQNKETIIYANQLDTKCTMNVSRITKYVYTYLNISNAGKSGGTWKIKVTNPFNYKLKVYYNTKMCYEGDAKEWKGLKDETTITLEPNQTKTVNINTNWFATSVAFSYIAENGVRVITYANGLGTDGSINVMTNYV